LTTYGCTSRAQAAAWTSPPASLRKSPSISGYWRSIPTWEGARDEVLRPGLRSFPVDDYLIIHRIVEDDVVLILHVVHGSRDIHSLFGH
jgi:hypothetical protein